ncbi:MAG: N-acetylglucosamine kinase [Sediminibacterium sp. Gen4]|jgi:glucosamine kinase|uniref:N-acetylglucosamine kinase n=1 Tax=unclassified Sediminibacterium TaxID=2635961 RepID=UPI0015BFB36C|nr:MULTISPECIES: N-acetylglucosamine kinase [unclassified Sediminibacterium]MBW0161429.1 N-acetylglucosamine kinase [Sediminibacterium sp.]MBW0164689.1 N-acetylglucosamine kinase [Sediminibacterium sp.]NWK65993.1 N-acetylglucosamine kinase [Sediminibacterium sp. Gen4]
MPVRLIADSGATKCEWCVLENGKKKKTIYTQGISPYFLSGPQIISLLEKELLPKLKNITVQEIYFYGTGLGNPNNVKIVKAVFKKLFPKSKTEVQNDLLAAARALCGKSKGIACILGTGANSCFYNGKKIVKNSPGLGYILGDEGSGAYLGKKVVQYYLYNTYDEELKARFEKRFMVTPMEILENVYKKPLANRYLASYAIFLAENRGHYMIENIIEDGLNDFFFTHLYKYRESWTHPIHFVGSIAFGFKDVLKELCSTYELELGRVLKAPMQGLIEYHR